MASTAKRGPPKAVRESKAAQATRILKAAVEANSHVERGEAYALLCRKLPPGVPHALITRFWAEQMRFPAVYYRLRATPDEYIDAVLAGLRAWSSPGSDFLVRSVADAPSADALRAANKAFFVIANSPNPFTPKGRATIVATLADPRFLAGAQAVVAAHGWKGDARSFMRALVYDGSDASVEVLRPWVQAAVAAGDPDAADLRGYTRFAETPAMKALFAPLGEPAPRPRAPRSRKA
jgi:hypothetical protein